MHTLNIPLTEIKAVIFDVDGTLYNPAKLKFRMLFALLRHYWFRPMKYKELIILYHFRKEREKKIGHCSSNLDQEQYEWCANKLKIPAEKVKEVIAFWIYEFPLKYINGCKFKGIDQLFAFLREHDIKICIYSDYPAKDKLDAMHLSADLVVTSTDAFINCFKPQPKAVEYICSFWNVLPKECIFIGDRYSRDGKCAENAGAVPLLLPDDKKQHDDFFSQLNESLKAESFRATVAAD